MVTTLKEASQSKEGYRRFVCEAYKAIFPERAARAERNVVLKKRR